MKRLTIFLSLILFPLFFSGHVDAKQYAGEYLIQSAESSFSLVPYRETVAQNFGKLCLFNVQNNKGVDDQRWYFVDTGNGFLIKNVKSGLSLVPYRETVNENFGELCMFKVVGTGVHDQRWRFVETPEGILIQNVESGLSLVPYRETVAENFGKLCIYQVNDTHAVVDQKWRFVKVE